MFDYIVGGIITGFIVILILWVVFTELGYLPVLYLIAYR